MTSSGSPSLIWETLEHGESVECLNCIPAVEPLIYDNNAEVREIAAWWLRRRIFGVFGAGEVYEHTVNAVKSDPNPQRRAYAAYALGEFLDPGGRRAARDRHQHRLQPARSRGGRLGPRTPERRRRRRASARR